MAPHRSGLLAGSLTPLLEAVAPGVDPTRVAATAEAWRTMPNRLRQHLKDNMGDSVGRVIVTGTLERRLVLVERSDGRWSVADLSGLAHETRHWPAWLTGHIDLDKPSSWLSTADLDEYAVHRLSQPRLLLAALYHPENFPLPRFPLAISAVARAARSTLTGTTKLLDMQLGVDLQDLVKEVSDRTPDVLGISATFGQHDLLVELLNAAYALPEPPLVVAGGSLTVRNERLLLEAYPDLLVARGAGEPTIRGILAHWHGDIRREDIPGIGYTGAPRGAGTLAVQRRTGLPAASLRDENDILPELDLLDDTFRHHGVAQIECSRGCTSACSFCPRGHKGQWNGAGSATFPWLLDEMGRVFDQHPGTARILYAVDEEFIGRGADAVPRALDMAATLHGAGFSWETSCRIDQVVDPDRDLAWHAERAEMWRELVQRGLRRCLFGVESGVDSILERFRKDTTGEQSALAIRTLSALGIPTRFTYITFDHLMTLEELKATYAFQGRDDLLLRPLPHLSVEEIVAGVRDEDFVAKYTTGRQLHQGISYMLVSMECLIGAAYTRMVQAAGLAGAARPSMGRQDADFADWRIGVASEWAQRWIDRNFALDYTLKSLEKILDQGEAWRAVRVARVVLKDAAYAVLGRMVGAIEETPLAMGVEGGGAGLHAKLRALLDEEIANLGGRAWNAVHSAVVVLPGERAELLTAEYRRWRANSDWELINAGDPCGT
ncbi:B12-binding domain-containing radical SAM protein [Streptomyces sp. NRRL B-24484]|uniref:B12-binding domain-containing radical SAM protein n=1 Tax=Streptomyces sp. NRRL B-24484 TaxID=1463833 RepID=UPI001F2F8D61|nr:radical SAM protein [Streptomyces sp. NRRL B-24484]